MILVVLPLIRQDTLKNLVKIAKKDLEYAKNNSL